MRRRKFTKKAFSLVESVVVLGIVSTTLVASISLMVNALITVRLNDVEEAATGIMIEALEIAKSPTTVSLERIPGTPTAFKISTVPGTNENYLEVANNQAVIVRGLDSCDNKSEFQVKNNLIENTNVCLYAVIDPPIVLDNDSAYRVEVNVYYQSGNGLLNRKIIGYRYETFKSL